MAPLYDLVSTIAWPELSTRLAMNIGHGKAENDLNPANFKRLAEEGALGWPMVKERVFSLANRTLSATAALGAPPGLADAIRTRCDLMMKQLG